MTCLHVAVVPPDPAAGILGGRSNIDSRFAHWSAATVHSLMRLPGRGRGYAFDGAGL
jgi:hypothetical protein